MTNMIRLVTFLPSMVLVAWLCWAVVWRLRFNSKVKQTRDMDDPIHELKSILQWKEKCIVCGMISIDVLWIRRFDNKWECDVEWSDQIKMDIRNESLFFSAAELAHVTYPVNLFSAIAIDYKSLSSIGTISVERWRSHCGWDKRGVTKRLFATVWWFWNAIKRLTQVRLTRRNIKTTHWIFQWNQLHDIGAKIATLPSRRFFFMQKNCYSVIDLVVSAIA